MKREVQSLDDYIDACRTIFAGFAQAGAVAFKDISAYTRALDYSEPDRAGADALFSSLVADPRRSLTYPDETRPLNDYLFHRFLDMARDLNLPVQLHTGSLGGFGKDIRQANAAHLTRTIQLHPDVRFDLFHANWPYDGEVLFLAKNYSHVAVNLCWTHVYDAVYSRRFLRQALTLVPHVKIHGYGSDYLGYADRAWAHVQIALDNISDSLAQLVDTDWLSYDDAMEVADCLLFRNPNDFYQLNL